MGSCRCDALCVQGQTLGRGGLPFSSTDASRTTAPAAAQAEHESLQQHAGGAADASPVQKASTSGPFTPQMVEDMGVLAPVSLSAEAMYLIASMRNTNPPSSMVAQGTLTPATDVGPPYASAETTAAAASSSALSLSAPYSSTVTPNPKTLPRETGEDIGIASPVPLTREAIGIITRLRNMKDEGEDWSRWRDVIFRAKAALAPKPSPDSTMQEEPSEPFEPAVQVGPDGRETLYCPECYLPLHPDPLPENLYIFLHAKKYSTSDWSFETEMPLWARPGYEWER